MKIDFLTEPFEEKTQMCFFIAGIVFFIIFSFISICYNIIQIENPFPECIFWKNYHIYCPGCGGTRAVTAMLHGNLLKSFFYHPFVPYVFIMNTLFVSSAVLYHLSLFRKRFLLCPIHFCLGIIILLLQFFIKNILLLVFHMPMQ